MILPEAGYTPANLRALIESRGWTQKQAADACRVAERTLRGWLVEDIDSASHRDCPLRSWRKLLNTPVS
jgi:transcriptional regulator with XRE-family HTH domain